MQRSTIALIFILITAFSHAQKKKEIKKAGIRSITITETQDKKTFTDSKSFYDVNGLLIQEINYDKEGVLKSTTKYKYNKDGDAIEELEYDEKNVIKEKRSIKYSVLGEKIEELIVDKDGKQLKKNVFTYDAKGLKTERKTYDANNNLVITKKYSYGYK